MNTPRNGWLPYSPRAKPDFVSERQESNYGRRVASGIRERLRDPEAERCLRMLKGE